MLLQGTWVVKCAHSNNFSGHNLQKLTSNEPNETKLEGQIHSFLAKKALFLAKRRVFLAIWCSYDTSSLTYLNCQVLVVFRLELTPLSHRPPTPNFQHL